MSPRFRRRWKFTRKFRRGRKYHRAKRAVRKLRKAIRYGLLPLKGLRHVGKAARAAWRARYLPH